MKWRYFLTWSVIWGSPGRASFIITLNKDLLYYSRKCWGYIKKYLYRVFQKKQAREMSYHYSVNFLWKSFLFHSNLVWYTFDNFPSSQGLVLKIDGKGIDFLNIVRFRPCIFSISLKKLKMTQISRLEKAFSSSQKDTFCLLFVL